MTEAKNPEKTDDAALSQELGEKEGAEKKVPEKTPEELQAQIKEYESKLGQAGQELGELKKRIIYVEEDQRRRDYELAARNLVQERKEHEPPEDQDEFDYARPGKSVVDLTRKTMAQEFEKREKARQLYDQQVYQEYAKKNYEAGWRSATAKNPSLFDGIQSEVQDLIYQSFAAGKLGIDDLSDERVWERTGQLLWLEKGNVDKITKPRREPTRLGQDANLPEQVRSGLRKEGVYNFDEKSREIMKGFNLKEEDAKKIIDDEAEKRAKGEM